MRDPHPLYARLRAEDPVHYMERYDAWAVASFAGVWQVCGDTEHFTTTTGQHPGSVLYGLPASASFPDLDPPEHRFRRRLVSRGYTREMARHDEQRVREIARTILGQVLAAGDGTMDAYRDYLCRVTAHHAAEKAGLPWEDAERIRTRIDDQFAREVGQVGMSPANVEAAMEVAGYLMGLVGRARSDPAGASGLLGELMESDSGLSDEQLMWELFTVLVTGSDTVELAAAATLHQLDAHPDQLTAVRADPTLLPWAFAEAARLDHPTNILARGVKADVQLGGKKLRRGQGVLLLWASACRDEAEFDHADRFDIHRRPARSLLFGHGQHQCMGEHLAMRMGPAILDEFLSAISSYEVDRAGCERLYGEFFKGFNKVPVAYRVDPSRADALADAR